MMFLQMAAWQKMTIERADARTAFLQGRPIERELFVVPVPELAEALGITPGEAARLLKSSYGLVDAPLEWFLTVVEVFKGQGWQQTDSDPCTFTLHDEQAEGVQKIISEACWHVDDFEFAGRETDSRWLEARARVKEALKWQEWERGDYVQLGVRTKQLEDFSVRMEQRNYVQSIDHIDMNPQRKKQLDEKADDNEVAELRAVV